MEPNNTITARDVYASILLNAASLVFAVAFSKNTKSRDLYQKLTKLFPIQIIAVLIPNSIFSIDIKLLKLFISYSCLFDFWILLQTTTTLSDCKQAVIFRSISNIIHHLCILDNEFNWIVSLCYVVCWGTHLFGYMGTIGINTFRIICNCGNLSPLLALLIYIFMGGIERNGFWIALQMFMYRTLYMPIKYTNGYGLIKGTPEQLKFYGDVCWWITIVVSIVSSLVIIVGG